jgi:hypothetical protein
MHTASEHDAVDLFLWRGAGIVLLGMTEGDRWIAVRGWVGPGTLTHVRRWSFASPDALCGQIRRLAYEATGDHREAGAAGEAARAWAVASASPRV